MSPIGVVTGLEPEQSEPIRLPAVWATDFPTRMSGNSFMTKEPMLSGYRWRASSANWRLTTVLLKPAPTPDRSMSMEANANVRFLTIGAPRLQFASFRRKIGTPAFWNRLGAWSLLLVWYQPSVP